MAIRAEGDALGEFGLHALDAPTTVRHKTGATLFLGRINMVEIKAGWVSFPTLHTRLIALVLHEPLPRTLLIFRPRPISALPFLILG